ncbi:glycosyltransferase [Microbacterium marmarense]|uniref:Glycosyltransferase n=1 Tax=Microbacterium marmarense TaxID=3122051 RepID=A0ABU8LQY5_9MICO
MSAPRVDVIIVNYNTCERTIECIESVPRGANSAFRVILVDNGSSDGSVERIGAACPDVKIIDVGENIGFARGVNRGVAESDAVYVLLLNPDTTVLSGSLEALVAFAELNPEYGIYGGRTVTEDGSLDPSSCWGAPTLWSLACFATGASTAFKQSAALDPESLGGWARDTVREVPVVTGCLLLVGRADWQRIGGMDERFFLYGEDAEFSARARAAGYRPVIVPEAVIQHDVGGSTGSTGRKMAMVMAGKVTYLWCVWTAPAALAGVLLLQAGAGLRAGLEVATRSAKRTWRDVWANRRAWRKGYPSAERTLFGRQPRLVSRQLRVQAEPAFRTEGANPYNGSLYRSIQVHGAHVRDLQYWRLVTHRTDVVHLHWPELSFLSGSRCSLHIVRLALFYSALAFARLRGTVLVWTVHNVTSHEERSSPHIRRVAQGLLIRNVDGIIALSEQGIDAARQAYPQLVDVPAAVTAHGHYRNEYDFAVRPDEARKSLNLPADGPVIVAIGQLRPYKNIPHLIEVFRSLDSDATLLIAGKPSPIELEQQIREAAGDDPRVVLDLRFVPDEDIPVVLAASDLVVLPYSRIQNSGSAILAASADRPVLVPDLGAMRELQTQLGEEWVQLFDGELTAEDLKAAIEWATTSRQDARPNLAPLEWDVIGEHTLDAYRLFRATRQRNRRRLSQSWRASGTGSVLLSPQ